VSITIAKPDPLAKQMLMVDLLKLLADADYGCVTVEARRDAARVMLEALLDKYVEVYRANI
jgi:hypothetical protein